MTEKLERLEAKRLGKVKNPRKSLEDADTAPGGRGIPAPVRRFVWARDQAQCTFEASGGRRCPEGCNSITTTPTDSAAIEVLTMSDFYVVRTISTWRRWTTARTRWNGTAVWQAIVLQQCSMTAKIVSRGVPPTGSVNRSRRFQHFPDEAGRHRRPPETHLRPASGL